MEINLTHFMCEPHTMHRAGHNNKCKAPQLWKISDGGGADFQNILS